MIVFDRACFEILTVFAHVEAHHVYVFVRTLAKCDVLLCVDAPSLTIAPESKVSLGAKYLPDLSFFDVENVAVVVVNTLDAPKHRNLIVADSHACSIVPPDKIVIFQHNDPFVA